MTTCYTPEMGQKRPEAQIEARYGGNGHKMIETQIALKGRGIKFIRTLRSEDLTAQGQRKVGWHQYRVTDAAYEGLEAFYSISRECLLD